MPFSDSVVSARHLDAWGAALLAAAVVASLLAAIWLLQVRRWWRHHPYRLVVQGHIARGMTATAVLLAIASASHLLGWTVYALPVLGLVALALLALMVGVWRWGFLPGLRRYEARHPEVIAKRAKLRLTAVPAYEVPLLAAIAGGAAAYVGFVWHPWNHVFHLGMWVLGGLTAYAIASVVATQRAPLPRVESPWIVPRGRGRGRVR